MAARPAIMFGWSWNCAPGLLGIRCTAGGSLPSDQTWPPPAPGSLLSAAAGPPPPPPRRPSYPRAARSVSSGNKFVGVYGLHRHGLSSTRSGCAARISTSRSPQSTAASACSAVSGSSDASRPIAPRIAAERPTRGRCAMHAAAPATNQRPAGDIAPLSANARARSSSSHPIMVGGPPTEPH